MIQGDIIDAAIAAENVARNKMTPFYDKTIEQICGSTANGGYFPFEIPHFGMLLVSFFVNILFAWIIVQYFYYKKSRNTDYYFTFMLFSVSIFLLLYVLQAMSMSAGIALGLFAVFGMIRYRTESLQVRDMTYLFVIIALSAVNGLSSIIPFISVIVANILFLLFVIVLEGTKFLHQNATKIVLYEKINLVTPEKYNDLLVDVKQRTGLDVIRIEVGHIDFLRDVAFLKVYYNSSSKEINTIDHVTKFS
ncbi:MAG: DUF4956 domain-containing protein [Dysgonamonadaceae bacterium]|jgi:hypothetical protein|nr:DUF4956 domain-containing protein [Dysgonamonadaceae bacterium]